MTPTETSIPPLSRRGFLGATASGVVLAALPATRAAATASAPTLLTRQILTATAGEAIALAGSGFSPGCSVAAWLVPDGGVISGSGRTPAPSTPPGGSSVVTPVAIDPDAAIFATPSSLDGVVALYASSSDGASWSAPILLGAPDAWYSDRPSASAGDRVTVYGRNLRSETAAPSVSLWNGSALTACTVRTSTAYAVGFDLPGSIAPGSYHLVVSNGHGGGYAADSHLAFTVVTAPASPATAIDAVAQYGADPTGSSDSTQALQNALDAAAAASGGATVSLAAGTYTVTGKLRLRAASGPVAVVGSGSSSCTIAVASSAAYSSGVSTTQVWDAYGVASSDDLGILYLAPGSTPVTISGLTLETNSRRPICLEIDGRSGVVVTSCAFRNVNWPTNLRLYSGGYGVIAQNCRGLTIEHCSFIVASGIYLLSAIDTILDTNTFGLAYPRAKGVDPGANQYGVDQDGIKVWGARRLTIRGNAFYPGSGGYYARAIQFGAQKIASSTFGAAEACGLDLAYVGGNRVDGSGEPGSNCGESIVGDQFPNFPGARIALPVTSSSSTSVTVSGAPFATGDPVNDAVGADAIVIAGTGVGQVRRVIANTASTLTMDAPWDVLPAADSVVVVEVTLSRIAYVSNTAVACPKYLGNYGPSVFCVAADNTIDTTGAVAAEPADPAASGIAMTGIVTGDAPTLDVAFFDELLDNTLTGAHAYLQYDDFPTSASASIPVAPILRGNRSARNIASGTASTSGFLTLYPPSAAATMGRHNLSVRNTAGSNTAYDTRIGDARWSRTVHQGPGALDDHGTGTISIA